MAAKKKTNTTPKTTAKGSRSAANAAAKGAGRKAQSEATTKKVSALDAAVLVLQEEGKAMNCQEMIEVMGAKGYWQSPGGKTPASTLYSAILREAKVKGAETRFKKTERGKFQLKGG
jgi:HB1, ASXL, restriction endonuclease HTH domain